MHDAIELEKRGVPSAAICTEPFISSAKAMSKLGGIPDYPFVIASHPLHHLGQEDLNEVATRVAPEVLGILLAKS